MADVVLSFVAGLSDSNPEHLTEMTLVISFNHKIQTVRLQLIFFVFLGRDIDEQF